jgi:hypothetical protein
LATGGGVGAVSAAVCAGAANIAATAVGGTGVGAAFIKDRLPRNWIDGTRPSCAASAAGDVGALGATGASAAAAAGVGVLMMAPAETSVSSSYKGCPTMT